ncbi:MAG: hypothetical protein OXC19_22650 [Bryobacterales bacterium]|nr:hypothetical protein [Bryobacterales bacterium]
MNDLTAFEYWLFSHSPETIALLGIAKMLLDLVVFWVMVVPAAIALFRPIRFLWLTTRRRAGIVLVVGALWITALFWIRPVRDVGKFMDSFGPMELPPLQKRPVPLPSEPTR